MAWKAFYRRLLRESGQHHDHFDVIKRVMRVFDGLNKRGANVVFDKQGFVIEWLKRDLLNVIFGNSDNHLRNTSFIKKGSLISLSPTYDFAPMRIDPEGVIRTVTWKKYELGGDYQWPNILLELSEYVDFVKLKQAFLSTANKLLGLPKLLKELSCNELVLSHPKMSMVYLDTKLNKWIAEVEQTHV